MNRTQTYQVPKGKTKNGIVPVPIIVNGTNTHNSGDVAKQGSVRFNALGVIPFAKKLFSKKEKQQMAVAPKPLPEGELVISFYDSTKELLSTEILSLKSENEWETLSFSTKAEEKGFVSASIRGTSSEPAKFDDFSIQLKSFYSAKLYQENHYYPFGMNMKGLESSDKQSVQNKAAHEFQFNAQTEREESFGLFWDETPFRPMDMQLGRFWGVDLLSEVMPGITPFHYAYNNPIGFNDPTGLAPQFDMPDYTPPHLGPSTLSPLDWHRRGVDIHSRFPNRPPRFAGQKEAGQSQASDTDPPPGTEELAEENAVTATRLGGGNGDYIVHAGFGNDVSFGTWGYAAGFVKSGGYPTKFTASVQIAKLAKDLPRLESTLGAAEAAMRIHRPIHQAGYLSFYPQAAGVRASTLGKIVENKNLTNIFKSMAGKAKYISKRFFYTGLFFSAVDQVIDIQDYSSGRMSSRRFYTNFAWRAADLGVAAAALFIPVTSAAAPVIIVGAGVYFTGRFVYDTFIKEDD